MCVSAARVCVNFNGQQIRGVDSMKVLGVTIDRDCSFRSHVLGGSKKLRKKMWALSKLKRKGMKADDLVQAYCSTIRPVAEYASPAWHSLLTAAQSQNRLKDSNRRRLKTFLRLE